MTIKRSYGWRPDKPDQRDHLFKAPRFRMGLPKSVDLRPSCPPVWDQGDLGSCTAQAIGAAVQFAMAKQLAQQFQPSRLMIYYGERVIENSVGEDAGAEIRDGIKVVAKTGASPEVLWPYIIEKFTRKPPAKAYAAAKKLKAAKYERLTSTENQLKACLASGFPFVFGFSVYDSFETEAVARTGRMPVPKKTETLLGGHAVMAVGYSDAKKCFLVRNSWGTAWGIKGYFWMPYKLVTDTNFSDDFWMIPAVVRS
jgi:C1A family cysteine protease